MSSLTEFLDKRARPSGLVVQPFGTQSNFSSSPDDLPYSGQKGSKGLQTFALFTF